MNKNSIDNISKTNWERVDALTEEEIDISDIPLLTEELFSKSKWWKPVTSVILYTILFDKETNFIFINFCLKNSLCIVSQCQV